MPELGTSGSDGGPGRATAQVYPTRGQLRAERHGNMRARGRRTSLPHPGGAAFMLARPGLNAERISITGPAARSRILLDGSEAGKHLTQWRAGATAPAGCPLLA